MIERSFAQNLNDEQLMEYYQKGDYLAFEVLYLRHKNSVYQYLKRKLNSQDQVEEVFQNIFLKLHKSRHQYQVRFLFVKWLFTITRTQLIDYYRLKKIAQEPFLEEIHTPSVQQDEHEKTIQLQEVNSLSDKEKNALTMKFYSDMDYQQMSKALNTSNANARKIVSRALGKLKKKMSLNQSN